MEAERSTGVNSGQSFNDERIEELISKAIKNRDLYLSTDPDTDYYFCIALDCLREAVDLGSPKAMYLLGMMYKYYYLSVWYWDSSNDSWDIPESRPTDQEIEQDYVYKAVKLFENACSGGCNNALNELISHYCYICPDHQKAYFYLLQSADQGCVSSLIEVATREIEGKGTSQDYLSAFLHLWQAAISSAQDVSGDDINRYFACLALSDFYISNRLFPCDYPSALFWALMSQQVKYDQSTCDYISGLTEKMDRADILECQEEVKEFANDLNLIAAGHSSLIMPPEEYYEKHRFRKDKPKPAQLQKPDNLGSQFVIDDIAQLTLSYYIKDNNITLICNGSKKTYKAQTLLNANCLELLTRYNKQDEHNEPLIGYYAADIYDATSAKERSNRQIVSDFNHALRKHFKLGKEVKPFVWIGKGKNRILRANFTLKVKY